MKGIFQSEQEDILGVVHYNYITYMYLVIFGVFPPNLDIQSVFPSATYIILVFFSLNHLNNLDI